MGHSVFGVGRRIRKAICLALSVLLTIPNLAFAGQIVIDGNTQTVVTVQGDTTDITTSTLLGQNAFNSFSLFNVYNGETVNLHVPSSATNLLNLVHDDVSTINGMLNSIQDGKIGGNIFFLNPHGFIVGTEGVLNVGSLTVLTPTQNFTNDFFTAPGAVNPGAASAVLEGQVPISRGGLISVKGQINAVSDIHLSAGDVSNSGSIESGASFITTSFDFSDVVNVGGLESGAIEISALNDFVNEGQISADGANNLHAGSIAIRAGNDVTVTGDSTISARGHGEQSAGGTIDIYAGASAEFDGGFIDVQGGEISGDAGFIEFSGKKRVTLDGGIFKASANRGQAGSILIDPEEIVIETDQFTDGAEYSLIADKSITVGNTAIISTRNIGGSSDHLNAVSVGNSGNLILKAPEITVGDGAMLLAHAINAGGTSYQGGNIELTASQTDTAMALEAAAAARITIGAATLRGQNISLSATSNADYEFSKWADLVVREISNKLGPDMVGVNVGIAQANASSEVILGAGATLEAAGDVNLTADATASAKTFNKEKTTTQEFGLGFVYGEVDSTATVDIQSGATIKASNLSLSATNTANLDVNVQAVSQDTDAEQAALGLTFADVNSLARVASGANIDVDNDIAISALNTNSFSTQATAKARETGVAGIAAAIFTGNTSAQAILDADLTGLSNLGIVAYDNTIKDVTTASGITGGSEFLKPLTNYAKETAGLVMQKIGLKGIQLKQVSGAKEGPKLAGAISIANVTQNATAKIGDSALVLASGDVAVVAQTRHAEVQNKAVSSVKSKADTGEATYALSAALAIADYAHNAEASIGNNAQVTADRLGVRSDVLMPYGEKWVAVKETEVDGLLDTIDWIIAVKDAYGAPLLTGFANATGKVEDAGINGSINYMDFTNNSQAYIGQGARITLLPSANTDWETTLPNEKILNWNSPLSISANTDITGVFAAGNINFTLAGAAGGDGAASVGGAYNQVNHNNTTRGYISGGATVEHSGAEAQDVSVTARTEETAIVIGPTSGRGGAYGLSGMVSIANVDSTTESFVSNKANVAARNLLLNASEEIIVWSLTGAFNKSEAAGVGAAIAWNNISTTTRAFIGASDDESELLLPSGEVSAETVNVGAVTDGRIEAVSVVGAIASSNPPEEPSGPSFMDKVKGKMPGFISKLMDKVAKQEPSAKDKPATEPKFGLAISGSASVNEGALTTEAYVEQANLALSGDQSELTVRALNDTQIAAVSGGGALAKAKKDSSKFSGALAGAVAVNSLSNSTTATVRNSTVTGANDVSVQALASGSQFALGIGLAVNASADQDKAAEAAGSVSVNLVSNDTTAHLKDSQIIGAASGSDRVLNVTSYDRTNIGTGGGSLIAGGKAGIGATVTYSEINNSVGAYLSGSTVSNYDALQVHGLSAASIGAGGGMAGFTTKKDTYTFGGAIVVSSIANEVTAQITDSSSVNVTGDVEVLARDTKGVAELDALVEAAAGEGIPDELEYTGSDELFGESEKGTSIVSVAGVAQASGSNAGVSFTWNDINNTYSALVTDSTIQTPGDLRVNAINNSRILGLSVGAGLATGQFAGAASVTVNEIGGIGHSTTAGVSGSTITANDVTVNAEDNSEIDSLAGQVTVSIGKVSVGGAIAHNEINSDVGSIITGSDITAGGAALVQATNDSIIRTLAAAGGGSAGLAFNASVSDAQIANSTTAEILDSTLNATGQVKVLAEDESEIDALAGAVSVASKGAVGAGVAVNTIANTTRARISGTMLGFGNLLAVEAANSSIISTLAAAAGGAASAAVTGSVGTSNISNVTEAEIVNSQLDNEAGSVNVTATDEAAISSITGGAAISGTASVGVATSVNRIANQTNARVSGGLLDVGNLLITSSSDTSIKSHAIGVGGAGTVGVGASVAVNLIDSDTTSSIVGGAKITAQNNVGVIAETDDYLINRAGTAGIGIAAAGVGASVSVNNITGTTKAYISGADTEVIAHARAAGNKLLVAEGSLSEDVDLASGLDIGSYGATDLDALQQTKEVSGLAVNASATHSMENVVANIAGGMYAGVAGTTSVNTITGATGAYIDGAKATSGNDLSVQASDHAYGHSFVGTLGAGAAGIGLGVETTVFANDTRAFVRGLTAVIASGTLAIAADSSQGASSLTTSGGAGVAGVVGTGTVGTFSGTTEAYLQSPVVNVGSLWVTADHDARLYVAAGGLSAGGAAVGGTFTVGIDESTTKAYVQDTSVNTTGDVEVGADSTSELRNWAASGSAAGAAGVAGTALVSSVSNTTLAYIGNSQLGSLADRVNNVSVTAMDSVISENTAGAVGLAGSAGVGATAAVVKVDNTTSAFIDDSTVYANDDVSVDALAVRDLATTAVSGGIGFGTGLGGAVAVTVVGSELTGEVTDELNKDGSGTLSQVDELTQANRLVEGSNVDGSSGLTADELAMINAAGQTNMTERLNPTAVQSQTSALVVDSAIVAKNDAQITAADKFDIKINSGAVAGGMNAGIGGSVGVADVTANVTAAVQGGSSVTAEDGLITIAAESGAVDPGESAVNVQTYQGSGGTVSLGAAVSTATVTGNVSALAGENSTLTLGDTSATTTKEKLTVEATDDIDVNAEAYGASIGMVAAGAVVATATKDGTTQAILGSNQVDLPSGLLQVNSQKTGAISAYSLAGSGGVASGAASVALAEDGGAVEAAIGDAVTVAGSGTQSAVNVEASSTPQVAAEADGVVVSTGYAVGISAATARTTTEVTASVGSDSNLTANKLDVVASTGTLEENPSVQSSAMASGGGLLLGVNATSSVSENGMNVTSSVGSGTVINAETTSINAQAETKQRAEATSINGGLLAGGGNQAKAISSTTITAQVEDNVDVSGQQLKVIAEGTDDNFAKSTAGSGGVVSGYGANAITETKGSTTASVGAGSATRDIFVTDFDVLAKHTANFNSQTDSISAAVIGGSGADAKNYVDYGVAVNLGAGAIVRARDIDITASNNIVKDWLADEAYNVQSGSGGAIDGAAASSVSEIANRAEVNVGSTTLLEVYGDRSNPGHLTITAVNDLIARDRVKLDSGGAITIALADSKVINDQNDATVTIGSGAKLNSVGDIDVSVRTNAEIETNSNVKTYGAAGAAQGESESRVDVENRITVGNNVAMSSAGDINLRAGNDRLDNFNNYVIQANTDLWNKTLLPISTKPEADAALIQSNTISLGTGSNLSTVGHIRVLTESGTQDVRGYGVGKDLFREAMAEIGEFFGDLVGGGDVSLEIKGGTSTNEATTGVRVDGTLEVGIENQRYLTINEDGTIDKASSEGITVTKSEQNLVSNLQERLDRVNALIAVIPDDGASTSSNPAEVAEKATLETELNEKTSEYQAVVAEQNSLRSENETKQTDIDANLNSISNLENEITTLEAELAALESPTDPQELPTDPQEPPAEPTRTAEIIQAEITQKENQITELENTNTTLNSEIAANQQGIEALDAPKDILNARIIEINNRIEELNTLLAGSSTDDGGTGVAELKARYLAEKAMLEAQLAGLGGSQVDVIEVNEEITAQSANIYIIGDTLSGQGKLLAPGDSLIRIENKSSSFLRTNNLIIPDEAGGRVYFNNVSVTNNAEINQRNSQALAQFGQIATADNTVPQIIVVNSYTPTPGERAPDIFLDGDVRNRNGLVDISSSYGSVQIKDGVDVVAETIKISAGKDVFIGYKDGIQNVGGDIQQRWSDFISDVQSMPWDQQYNYSPEALLGISGPYDPSILAGNSVFISGQYLNVNGVIQSGLPNRTLEIPASLATEIAAYKQQYESEQVSNPIFKDLSINAGAEYNPAQIPVYYNAELDCLELAPVEVMGGYMELYGHIMNTSVGELRVMDGYGTIDIDNNTGTALRLNTLNTGSGIEGTIKITDTAKKVTVGALKVPMVTVYKRLGSNVQVYNNDNASGLLNMDNPVSVSAGRSSEYKPLENQYYSWTVRDRKTWTERKTQTRETWFWAFDTDVVTTWGATTIENVETDVPIGADVVRVVPGKTSTYWYDRTYYLDQPSWSSGSWYESDSTMGVWKEEKKKYWRSVTETTLHNHNIYASNPIKISFMGNDTGQLTVNSVGDIIVDGQLKNTAGGTQLTTGGTIRQGSYEGAAIAAENLNLMAGTGIGDTNRSVRTDLVATGNLNAQTTTGNIFVEETKGNLIFGQVTANNGSVNLFAESSIVAANGSALIKGKQVSLEAQHGGIGTSGTSVLVNTEAIQTGGLTATAAGDIYLQETTGDLYLNTVESLGGNVLLRANTGSIIDNNDAQSEDTRVKDELLALWDEMALTGEKAQESAEQTVSAYERMKEQEYRTYWQYRERFAPGSTVELSALEANYYRNELGWGDAEISALEQRRTAEYHQLHQVYGSLGTTYDADWIYTASVAERESLIAGSEWTQAQLENSLGIGVLKETSDTRIWIEDPNVAGRNVDLWAAGNIGHDLTSQAYTVKLNGRTWSELTEEEKLMILSAERQDITFTGADEITITSRDAVDVQALGQLTASASENIYLGSEVNMNLGQIVAGGDIRLKSRQSINNAAGSGVVNISGKDTILEAGRGSIGQAGKAVVVDLGANTLTARAADNIYLQSYNDNLNLDAVYAVHHVELVSPKSIVNAGSADLNIRAESLNLLAQNGSIGSSSNFINLGLDPTGSLSANATGDIFINSPQHSLRTSKVTAAGNITLFGGSDVFVESALGGISTTSGNVRIDVGGSILDGDEDAESGVTAQNIALVAGDAIGSAENDLEVDVLSPTIWNVSASKGVFLTETAGNMSLNGVSSETGSVRLTALAGNLLTNQAVAKGDVTLSAHAGSIEVGIVDSDNKATLEAQGRIDAEQIVAGDHVSLITQTGDIVATTVSSATGAATLNAGSSIVAETVTAGSDIALTAQDGVTVTSEVNSTDGDVSVNAETGDIVATTINAANGTATLNAGAGIDIGEVMAVEDVNIVANGGDIAAGSVSAGNVTMTSQAGNIAISAVDSDSEATLEAQGRIDAEQVAAVGNISMTAHTGDITTNTISTTSGTATLNAGSSIVTDTVTAGGEIGLTAQNGISVTNEVNSAAGTITVNAGTSINVGQVAASGNIGLAAKNGDIAATTISSGTGAAALEAQGQIDAEQVAAVGNISMTAHTGDIVATTINAANGTATLNAGAGIDVSEVIAAGDVNIVANGGDIAASSVSAGNVTMTAETGSIEVSTIGSKNEVLLEAQGRIDAEQVGAVGNISLIARTGNIIATIVTSNDGAVTLDSGLDIQSGDINANENISLIARANVNVTDTVESNTGNVTVNARGGDIVAATITSVNGTATLNSEDSIDIDEVTAGGTVTMTAETGSIEVGTVESDNEAMLEAQGQIDAEQVVVESNISFIAHTGDIIANTISTTTGAATLDAGSSIVAESVTANRDITLTAQDGVTVTSEANSTAGDISVNAETGNIAATTVNAADGAATLSAGASINVGQVAASGNIGLAAQSGDIAATTINSATGFATLNAGSSIVAETVTAEGDVTMVAGSGSIEAGTVDSNSEATLEAQGGIDANEVLAGSDISLTAYTGDIAATTINAATGAATLNAGAGIDVSDVAAGGDVNIMANNGDIAAGSVSAGNVTMTAETGNTVVGTVDSDNDATLYAKERLEAEQVVAGRNINVTAQTGDIAATTINSATGAAALAAGTNIIVDTVTAGGKVAMTAGTGSIEASTIDSEDEVLLEAQGRIDAEKVAAVGNISMTAHTGDIAATTVNAANGTAILTAGAGIKVDETTSYQDVNMVAGYGDILIGSVISKTGNVMLNTYGDILGTSEPAEINISAVNVDLTAENGNIGGSTNHLRIDSATVEPGKVSALAMGNVYLTEVDGDLFVDSVQAGQTVQLLAPSGGIYGVGEGVHIDSDRLDLESLGNINITLNVSDTLTGQTGESADLRSPGKVNIAGFTTAEDFSLNATEIGVHGLISAPNAVNLIADGSIIETESGTINSRALTTQSSGSQLLTGANTIDTFTAVNTGEGNIELTNTGDLTITQISQNDGNVISNNTGDIQVTGVLGIAEEFTTGTVELNSTGTINETGSGRILNATLTTRSVGGTQLSGANTIRSFVAKNNGGDVVLTNNAKQLLLDEVNQLNSGDVILAHTGELAINRISATGGDVDLEATGSIRNAANEDTINIEAINLNLSATTGAIGEKTGHLRVDSAGSSYGTITASAFGDINLTEVRRELNVNSISSASGDVEVVAHGSILDAALADVPNFAGDNIRITSQTGQVGTADKRIVTVGVGLTNVSANQDLYLEERNGALDSAYLISETGLIDLNAPDGSIKVERLSAAKTITQHTPYSVELGSIEAADLNLVLSGEGETLSIEEIGISDELTVSADNINFGNLVHTGTKALVLNLGGGSNQMAENITIQASSDVGIVVNQIEANFINLDAQVDELILMQAKVGSRAILNNRLHTVVADNVNKELFESDLQIFPENNQFYLFMKGDREILTDARTVNYDPHYIINGFDTENSFVRITSKMPEVVASVSHDTGTGNLGLSSSPLVNPANEVTEVINLAGSDLMENDSLDFDEQEREEEVGLGD